MILTVVERRKIVIARAKFCKSDGCVRSSLSSSKVIGDDNLESEQLLPKSSPTV